MTAGGDGGGVPSLACRVRLLHRPAGARLICLHHAGGSAATFVSLARSLVSFEVLAVRLPGRVGSRGEAWPQSAESLVSALVEVLLPLVRDRCWAVLGYSMGARLGLELTVRLVQGGAAPPVHLFACASRSPRHLAAEPLGLASLPDADLLREVVMRFGGIPAEIMAEPELLALTLPTLRADLAFHEAWDLPVDRVVPCGISAWSGTEDALVDEASLAAWREHTAGAFEIRRFEGGHFFHDTPAFQAAVEDLLAGARG